MCDTIEVNGRRCGTLASLRFALGGEPVIPDSDKQGFPSDCCLCVVDIEATAKAYGFESRFDACWLIHHFERPAQSRSCSFEERFPPGSTFLHCGRYCIVMRYVDEGEAMHAGRALGMHYEYADGSFVIRQGCITQREYPVIEAQNKPSRMEVS